MAHALTEAVIRQLIPADGHLAVFGEEHWQEDKLTRPYSALPVACWALIEFSKDHQVVVPMVMRVGADELSFAAVDPETCESSLLMGCYRTIHIGSDKLEEEALGYLKAVAMRRADAVK